MARPEFSEMLYQRRLELGMTTSQAARALRLKERVLVAFEAGDWSSMPKSGYAQGMLSSYARYLGLDAQWVTETFARDLEYYQEQRGSDDGRLRGPDSTSVVSASGRHQGFSGARGLLPTSGGYAGDMEGFTAVSSAKPHSSYGNYGQAMPTAGVGTSSGGGYSPTLRLAGGRVDASTEQAGFTDADQTVERRYTTREPGRSQSRRRNRAQGSGRVEVEGRGSQASSGRQTRQRSSYRPRVPVEGERPRRQSAMQQTGTRDQVTTRRVLDGDYTDDLRYNDHAESYHAASTRSGRARSIAAPERPNIQRRTRPAQSGRGSSSGLMGGLSDLLANSGNLVMLIAIAAAVIITVIIISSVSSCVANATSTGRESQTVATVQEDTSTGSADADASNPDDATGAQDAAAADAATTPTTTGAETKVEVTVAVADEGITWVEITLDGQTVVAETKTGPWSSTYTVTRSMKIDVSEPSVVTVTRNGAVQTFDSKASGVGTITIDGPDLPDETNEDTEPTEGATTSGEYTVLQYNDDGSWYDENWYYHDGNGGYYTDDGAYHEE